MVKIRDLIWYERLNKDKPYWFINSVNYEIVNIAEILEKLDIDDNYFITYCYDYDYVPLPVVDYGEIAKDYLVVLNDRQVSDYLKRLPEDEFGREFERIFHCGFAHEHWMEYFCTRKSEILINWCKENKIPYINDFAQ